LSALDAQKKLLVLEAEVQRNQLRADVEDLKFGLTHLAQQARQQAVRAGVVASSAALLFGGWRMFHKPGNNHKSEPQRERPSRWSRLVKAARTAGSIWNGVRGWMP
jgi:hypothetical protein